MAEETVSQQGYMPDYPSGYMPDDPVRVVGVFRLDTAGFFVVVQSVRDRRISIFRISEMEFRFLLRIGIPEIMVRV